MSFILRTTSLLLTSFFGAAGFQSGAGVLATELFNSTTGALNATNGGSGWAGAWQTQNGSNTLPGYAIVASPPLSPSGVSFGNYATGGANWQSTGRALDTSSGGVFASFLASEGLIGKTGTAIYFRMIMRKDLNTDDEMSVTLHPDTGAPWWVSSPGIAIGHFGDRSNSGGVRYWSLKLAGVVYRTKVPVVVGQATVLVCRVEFGAISAVSFFVNPPASGLPNSPDATATTNTSVAFRSLAWYAGSAANQSALAAIRFAGSESALGGNQSASLAPPSTVSAIAGDRQVTLSWSAVAQATAYRVYQVVNGTPQLASTATDNSSVITGLLDYATYTFYLVSVGQSGTSVPSASVTAVPVGVLPVPHPSLGTNLSQVTDYSRELPFVDAFKMARTWIPQIQGGLWGQGPALALDVNGWVTALQAGQYAETILLDNGLDDHPNFPAGRYTLLYDGEGTIQFDLQSATIVSQTPGRMVVNVAQLQNGVFLMVTSTNPANYLRNIRFIMPGFESSYQTQPFNPVFLKRLVGYRVLRFMEWMLTNGSTVHDWSARPTPADYTYTRRGVPLEVAIQLANTSLITPWFNVPAQATDAYVQQFAYMINRQLSPSLRFYLEYSNETWNSTFSQTPWIQAQGQAAGFSADPTLAGYYFNAWRSSQIFGTMKSVLSAPDRMIRVLAGQAANSWLSDQMLGFRNSFLNADVLAIAPYFNCDDSASKGFGTLGDPATVPAVGAMSVDQVIDVQLAHIQGCTKQEMQSSAVIAGKYGLRLVAYEGGQSLVGYNGAENDSIMTSLFIAANRNARMNSLYTQYLANWVAAGGDVFVHYGDVTSYTKFGSWGALEYQDQDPGSAPKYQSLMTFAVQNP